MDERLKSLLQTVLFSLVSIGLVVLNCFINEHCARNGLSGLCFTVALIVGLAALNLKCLAEIGYAA